MAKQKKSQHPLDEKAVLRRIVEGTATQTGEGFFRALVENLAQVLMTHGAWITEYLEDCRRLRSLAFWMDGEWIEHYEYDIAGTPCEPVVDNGHFIHFTDNVMALFPDDPDLERMDAVSYMGVPLTDLDGRVLGHLAVLDTEPMPEDPKVLALFRIFAARAAAEMQRLGAESELREREEKLSRLVGSAMDAIIELDQNLEVTLINAAAEKVLGVTSVQVGGRDFNQFLGSESQDKLTRLIRELDARPEGQQYLWIPGGLRAIASDGQEFPAEATLSRSQIDRNTFHTLIFRNVNERLEAERRIRSLTVETEYLREEIKALHNFDDIIGRSKALVEVLRDVERVAEGDTTVLILGETGTGKELFARALHAASQRSDKPLIKVNCAAIPAALMESEFFGHEKGAFTGATTQRDGRFVLADGGTIFLDEIGELPLDLQVKLLRVLQEGELEPVGSSKTRKVDIRVIAATNRDLYQAVQDGEFRKDLYYRLNVFPITVPPLRDRGNDIALLVDSFAERCARRMGRSLEPLSPDYIRRLKAYAWPGNVRELENVIERAAITAQEGCLNLDRALPESTGGVVPGEATTSPDETGRVRTAQELHALERDNLILALENTRWRVSGKDGAARLLGMNPSTLNSRMKVLGIKRPR